MALDSVIAKNQPKTPTKANLKTLANLKLSVLWCRVTGFLIFLLIIIPYHAFGFNGNVGVIAGYDDNVNLTPEALDSAYTVTYLTVSHQRLHEKMLGESLLFLNASYKNFVEFNDEIDVSVGGQYSCFPMDNAMMTQGFMEGGIFRDRENPIDEFNWGKTGIQLKYFFNDRIKFDYIQAVRGRHFLESVEFLTETTSGSMQGSGGSGTTETIITKEQNDLLVSSDFGVQINCYSWLDIDLTALFGRLYSSIDFDEYNECGGAVSVNISPEKSWLVTLKTSQFKRKFTTDKIRNDTFSSTGLIISKMTDKFEVFVDIDVMENSSTINEESYKQQVTQCGITYFF